ncbi:MAG TPA: hypothetical protein VLA04_06030 [Verrucomicrobiae bacterium]|nr:hypothetical protein [Verrucomicrobiae bacterium]
MEPQTAEAVIAQWEQPERVGILSNKGGTRKLLLMASPLAVVLVLLAIWQRQLNFALAAAVLLVAIFAVRSQSKSSSLTIAVTSLRIVVGKREHMVSELAGFWLSDQGDVVEINLEGKKPGLLPITFLAPAPSMNEAREIMSQVLQELEPREKRFGDSVGSYFRL